MKTVLNSFLRELAPNQDLTRNNTFVAIIIPTFYCARV